MLKKHRIDALKIPSNISSSSGPSSTKVVKSAINMSVLQSYKNSCMLIYNAEQIQRGSHQYAWKGVWYTGNSETSHGAQE